MTTEEALEVIQKIADAWDAFAQTIRDAAQALQDMFRSLDENDEIYPERNGTPPKKYGMSLRKRPYKTFSHYQYIPVTPRDRPYQRRAY
jgi:hypothetical protein